MLKYFSDMFTNYESYIIVFILTLELGFVLGNRIFHSFLVSSSILHTVSVTFPFTYPFLVLGPNDCQNQHSQCECPHFQDTFWPDEVGNPAKGIVITSPHQSRSFSFTYQTLAILWASLKTYLLHEGPPNRYSPRRCFPSLISYNTISPSQTIRHSEPSFPAGFVKHVLKPEITGSNASSGPLRF